MHGYYIYYLGYYKIILRIIWFLAEFWVKKIYLKKCYNFILKDFFNGPFSSELSPAPCKTHIISFKVHTFVFRLNILRFLQVLFEINVTYFPLHYNPFLFIIHIISYFICVFFLGYYKMPEKTVEDFFTDDQGVR